MTTSSKTKALQLGASPASTEASARGMKVVKRETLKARIYREVRHALQAGKFEPGEAITVKLLEDELGAGAMPIRETLQRLVAEGALMNLPNGRVRVPHFTADEFDEIKEIRLRLEGYAVNRAAVQRTEAELERIERCHARLNEVVAVKSRWGEIVARNYDFHFSIYEAAHSSYLVAMIDGLWLRVSPLLGVPFKTGVRASREYVSVHEHNHANLVEAIRAEDGRAAESAIREMILASAAWFHRHHHFPSESIPTVSWR